MGPMLCAVPGSGRDVQEVLYRGFNIVLFLICSRYPGGFASWLQYCAVSGSRRDTQEVLHRGFNLVFDRNGYSMLHPMLHLITSLEGYPIYFMIHGCTQSVSWTFVFAGCNYGPRVVSLSRMAI